MNRESLTQFIAPIAPPDLLPLVGGLAWYSLSGIAVLSFLLLTVLVLVYMERKVSAHMQDRLGPMHVGWHGLLQPVADVIKLLTKEDIIPSAADKALFIIAPGIVMSVTILMMVPIPFSADWVGADLNLGLLYLFSLAGFTVIGIFLAGWASNNKYSLLGALRSTGQLLSFEIPMILAVLGVIMFAGTLSLKELVEGQKDVWYIFYQPIGFMVFVIVAFAETNRTPFDIPEGNRKSWPVFIRSTAGCGLRSSS